MYEHKLPTLTKQQLAAVIVADGLAHVLDDSPPRADSLAAQHHILVIGTLNSSGDEWSAERPGTRVLSSAATLYFAFGWKIPHARLPEKIFGTII